VLTLVVAAGCTDAYFIGPQPCFPPFSKRGGLACDIPLSAGAAFQDEQTGVYRGSEGTGTGETFTFTIPHTSLSAVRDYYVQRLPSAGWHCVRENATTRIVAGWKSALVVAAHAFYEGGGPPTTGDYAVQLVLSLVTYGSGGGPASC
jgi:hypothetical protein